MRRSRAFTLIEVLVVLIISALLAGAVIFRLWEPLRVATAADVCEQVQMLDHVARLQARQVHGQVKVVFDVGTNQAWRLETDRPTSAQRLSLPGGWKFDRIWVEGQTSGSGQTEVELSPDGYGRTYAVALSGPHEATQWLIFAAMSGDMTRVADESQAQSILKALEPAGTDTP